MPVNQKAPAEENICGRWYREEKAKREEVVARRALSRNNNVVPHSGAYALRINQRCACGKNAALLVSAMAIRERHASNIERQPSQTPNVASANHTQARVVNVGVLSLVKGARKNNSGKETGRLFDICCCRRHAQQFTNACRRHYSVATTKCHTTPNHATVQHAVLYG